MDGEKNMDYQIVRGMHDILPREISKWRRVEKSSEVVLRRFGYEEIRTPVLEESRLFERSVGDTTDIVEKEMYTFPDRKGRKLALRPEGTASVVRAYLEGGFLQKERVSRLFYYGPMFRYDRPQKGRYRQFYQLGVELFGGGHPFFDGEALSLLYELLKPLINKELYFALNGIGCRACRERYAVTLKQHFAHAEGLCEDCVRRLEKNPLRLLDCKVPSCREAVKTVPAVDDVVCESCRAHFEGVREYCEKTGLPVRVTPTLVRGLDYYTKTVFEAYVAGDDNAIAAGGRYDDLVAQLGGPSVPAVGFAVGIERLVELMEEGGTETRAVRAFFLGDSARKEGVRLVAALRGAGIAVEADYEERGFRSHLKGAGREGVRWCMVLGDDEIAARKVLIKDMHDGSQVEVAFDELVPRLKEMTGC